MNSDAIFFEFDSTSSAEMAQGTLEELGYKTGIHSELSHPTLHIEVDHSELVSALEIAQAHGGRLIEHGHGESETDTYAKAYNNEDLIRIPAHVINEDWPESYATTSNAMNPSAGTAGESDSGNGAQVFDPSGDNYDHFDAGIRL